MQLQVINSPFNDKQIEAINQLVPTLTDAQKHWLSGFFAASQATAVATPPDSVPKGQAETNSQDVSREITILYGSETGNCQALAEEVNKKLVAQGFTVTLSSMDQFKPKNLKKVQDLLVITATHGEGDPPDNALSFYQFLFGRKAPKLEDLRFSVLSLGDQSYEFFCKMGKDFDERLQELGGDRFYPRADCDVDYDDDAAEWMEGVLSTLTESLASETVNQPNEALTQAYAEPMQSQYSRKDPFKAEVLENINLNGRGSNKETRHLELSLEDANLAFEPGDSLGIFPENDPSLVDQIIEEMKWHPEEPVTVTKQGDVLPLREALVSVYEITIVTKPLMEKAIHFSTNNRLIELLEAGNEDRFRDYIDGRDLLDMLRDFTPWNGEPNDLIQILRKIPARLYSIASSYRANPDEVHLTVGAVRYSTHGRDRIGVCSGQFTERIKPGDRVSVYIHHNPNFKLPTDPDKPIIMIGPGTGVAPYRSFLEDREEVEANGKTWLFFGDQHFGSDFLYQVD